MCIARPRRNNALKKLLPSVTIYGNFATLRTITFFREPDGTCQIIQYLDRLSAKEAQKVTWVLKIIEEVAIVPRQYFKKLANTEIWEVRVQMTSNTFRLLEFLASERNIILTHGFTKKSQKTPGTEIDKAEIIRIKLMGNMK